MKSLTEKPAWIYDQDYGWLNENHARLAEVLFDWDEHLRLLFIPEKARHAEDVKPYAIAYYHTPTQERPSYFVCQLTEAEVCDPARVLAMLFDMRDQDVNKVLDNAEAARKIIQAKKQEEEMEQQRDMAISMLRSPLHTYKADSGRKYRF